MAETKQLAWRVKEWREAVRLSHSMTHKLIAAGEIPSAKVGDRRLITESPTAFLERHREAASA